MNLLVDLGHSRLKWALDDGRWQVASCQADSVQVAEAMTGWKEFALQRVLVAASSGHPLRKEISAGVDACLGFAAEWPQSPAQIGRLRNAYSRPADLGIDRFLGMLAASDAGLAPCVLADCGTALTLDAVTGDGRHLGGVIVPGRELMLDALVRNAPALRDLPVGAEVDCAHSTADALTSGVACALAATVVRFRQRCAVALGTDTNLVVTGGNGGWLAGLLDCDAVLLDYAVLRGLSIWARLQPRLRVRLQS